MMHLITILLTHTPLLAYPTCLDSILGARAGDGSEHEASRRMKTELLVQMDGISSKGGKKKKGALPPQVFVMAASNMPWDLDVAGEGPYQHHALARVCTTLHVYHISPPHNRTYTFPLTLTHHLPLPVSHSASAA